MRNIVFITEKQNQQLLGRNRAQVARKARITKSENSKAARSEMGEIFGGFIV